MSHDFKKAWMVRRSIAATEASGVAVNQASPAAAKGVKGCPEYAAVPVNTSYPLLFRLRGQHFLRLPLWRFPLPRPISTRSPSAITG